MTGGFLGLIQSAPLPVRPCEQIVPTLSRQLSIDYGRSFGSKNLRHIMRFAEVLPEENIVYALSRQLSWIHFRALLYLTSPSSGIFTLKCADWKAGAPE